MFYAAWPIFRCNYVASRTADVWQTTETVKFFQLYRYARMAGASFIPKEEKNRNRTHAFEIQTSECSGQPKLTTTTTFNSRPRTAQKLGAERCCRFAESNLICKSKFGMIMSRSAKDESFGECRRANYVCVWISSIEGPLMRLVGPARRRWPGLGSILCSSAVVVVVVGLPLIFGIIW